MNRGINVVVGLCYHLSKTCQCVMAVKKCGIMNWAEYSNVLHDYFKVVVLLIPLIQTLCFDELSLIMTKENSCVQKALIDCYKVDLAYQQGEVCFKGYFQSFFLLDLRGLSKIRNAFLAKQTAEIFPLTSFFAS